AGIGRRRLLLYHLGVAEDDVDRRPQLVGYRRHELGLDAARMSELLDQAGVGQGQRGDLRDAFHEPPLLAAEAALRLGKHRSVDGDDVIAVPEGGVRAYGGARGWREPRRSVRLYQPLAQGRVKHR